MLSDTIQLVSMDASQSVPFHLSSNGDDIGYSEEFDPKLGADLICPICLFGLREPVQNHLGFRFCRSCLSKSVRENGSKCPVSNVSMNLLQVYPDPFAAREVLGHNVFCRFKEHGCPWRDALKYLRIHLEECEYVECTQECGKILKREDLLQHLEKQCPNREVPCNFCERKVIWKSSEVHHRGCPKYPLACGKCKKLNIPRDMMNEHLDRECPNVKIQCPFHMFGCTFEGLRTTVNKHVQGNLTSHLDDMAKGHADLVGTVAELSRRVSEVEEQLQEEALAENVRNLSLG